MSNKVFIAKVRSFFEHTLYSFNHKITHGGSMSSSGISNFQKIRQNFWHQVYNSGIYYTTPWKWHFAP